LEVSDKHSLEKYSKILKEILIKTDPLPKIEENNIYSPRCYESNINNNQLVQNNTMKKKDPSFHNEISKETSFLPLEESAQMLIRKLLKEIHREINIVLVPTNFHENKKDINQGRLLNEFILWSEDNVRRESSLIKD